MEGTAGVGEVSGVTSCAWCWPHDSHEALARSHRHSMHTASGLCGYCVMYTLHL